MSEVRVLVTLPAEVWTELKLRCAAKGIKDYRTVAGGFIQDALECGFPLEEGEEEARYAALLTPEATA